MTGIEPVTSSLPRKRSTPELHRLRLRAGDGIRTRDPQLGRLMLWPAELLPQIVVKWGEQDSNLRSRKTTDLQSAPVGRFGISPFAVRASDRIRTDDRRFTKPLLYQLSYTGFLRKTLKIDMN